MTRERTRIPATSVVFGYGPMLPLVAAAFGAWLLPQPWPGIVVDLSVVWGGLILSFVAGVRRGYGFGAPQASTAVAIAAMLVYFIPAGLALLFGWAGRPALALGLLILGYLLVAVLDGRAAASGEAPAHFSQLRPSQMSLAALAFAALLARVVMA